MLFKEAVNVYDSGLLRLANNKIEQSVYLTLLADPFLSSSCKCLMSGCPTLLSLLE